MTVQVLRVLSAMLADPYAEWYGLQLARDAELKTGTLYPILARLEAAHWISSYWEQVDPRAAGRPRRRIYRLTGEGADAARVAVDDELAQMQRFRERRPAGLGRVLRPGQAGS